MLVSRILGLDVSERGNDVGDESGATKVVTRKGENDGDGGDGGNGNGATAPRPDEAESRDGGGSREGDAAVDKDQDTAVKRGKRGKYCDATKAVKRGGLCIVRESGQEVGRLARWEFAA